MHRLKSTQCLINKVLAVIVREFLSSNDSVHISFHEFLQKRLGLVSRTMLQKENPYLDEVDFSERLQTAWLLNIEN
jgi:hypothetical protein